MAEYNKTQVTNMISVKSIVTAYRIDLDNKVTSKNLHDFPEIFYMAEKEGTTIINGETLHLKAGQMVIYGPNVPHGRENGRGSGLVEIISFETEHPLPEHFLNQVITLTGAQRMMLSDIIAEALSLFTSRVGVRGMMLKPDADPYALQRVKNLLELFLLKLYSPTDNFNTSRLQTITKYFLKNIEKALTLEDLSRELGLSSSTIKRLVHAGCGKTPIAYFHELKILEAKRLISETALNMTEISDRLGYSSVHHFSKAFKSKTGVTPTEYAKASRI